MAETIVVNQAGLRVLVDPTDPRRQESPVKTYKLSPEELAKYGQIKKPSKKVTTDLMCYAEYWAKKRGVKR